MGTSRNSNVPNSPLRDALAQLRLRLLDLTGRNRLLNYRHPPGKSLQFVQGAPAAVYQRLIEDRAALQIKGLPEPSRADLVLKAGRWTRPDVREWAAKQRMPITYDLPASSSADEPEIRSLMYTDDLARHCRKIEREAALAIEETGANMLHLVLGFLEFPDQKDSDRIFAAPLISIPVSLSRKDYSGRQNYFFQYTGDDIEENLSLREKLRQDHGVILPELDETSIDVEKYFNAITKVTKSNVGFVVKRRASLCLLSFTNMLLVRDLDPANWPTVKGQNTLLDHEIVRRVFGTTQEQRTISTAVEEHPVEEEPGISVPLVFDADSSQHSALIDALAHGRNLVIEGPPGTGKSQTITNLISAAIAATKRVLFVSEKVAALEVVRKRLQSAGLDQFVLELHSTKTNRKQVLESIQSRIDFQPAAPRDLPRKLEEIGRLRHELKAYVDLVNSVAHNSMGLSLFTIMWRCERARQQVTVGHAPLIGLVVEGVEELTEAELSRNTDCLEHLGAQHLEIGEFNANSPFWGFYPRPLLSADEVQVESALRELVVSSDALRIASSNLSNRLHERIGFSYEDGVRIRDSVATFMQQCSAALPLYLVPRVLDNAGHCEHARRCVQALGDLISEYQRLGEQVLGVVTEGGGVTQACASAARQLVNIRVQHGIQMGTLTDARSILQQLRDLLQDVVSGRDRIREWCSRLGIAVPDTFAELADLTKFAGLCSELPAALQQHQRETLLSRQSLSALTSLRSLQRRIKECREKLASGLYLDAIPEKDTLREAILTLRQGNTWYRFLQPSWRKALTLHRSLQVQKTKLSPGVRLQQLQSLLDLVSLEQRWNEDKSWAAYLPDSDRSLDFNLQAVVELATWNCEVVETGEKLRVANIVAIIVKPGEAQRIARDMAQLRDALVSFRGTDERIRHVCATFRSLQTVEEELGALQAVAESMQSALNEVGEVVSADVELEKCVTAIEAALHRSRIADAVSKSDARRVLGDKFDGLFTDTAGALEVISIAEQISTLQIPQSVKAVLQSGDPLQKGHDLLSGLDSVLSAIADMDRVCRSLTRFGDFNPQQWSGCNSVEDINRYAEGMRQRGSLALDSISALAVWSRYISRRQEAVDLSLTAFVDVLEAGLVLAAELGHACQYAVYNSIVRSAFRREPALGKFSGLKHNRIRTEFQRLDREIISLRGRDIASKCVRQAIPPGGTNGARVDEKTEMALLYHLLPQSRPRVPLRKLLKRASRAVQALKPCFMMGPQAVAQFLSADSSKFDIVVMDEASQLKPEEAIGAIARGSQLIVVGDPKQLPPTTFFTRMTQGGDEEEQFTTTDAESILDVCLSHFQPSRRLRWHYRSQHHSLIAFSNHYFYKNLVVFPSPYGQSSRLGVRATYLPDAVYEEQTNFREAERVVDAVVEHLKTRSEESLGVVTLNLKQRDLIADLLEDRLEGDESADKFRTRWAAATQPLFVKNLETVQGDERDAIIVSTTFGKPAGADAVRQNFGPISRQGGWRRLNVLFTRARKSISVFTSLRPEDIIVDGGTPEGTKALRNYLEFAQSGTLSSPELTGLEPESDFELSVMKFLNEKGFEVTPQLGVAGYRIDLAVKHPDFNGAYLAAVECDGATYHSAQSVRDRDRIRQEILEAMGWRGRIWRIWSTDWFRTPASEGDKLLSFLSGLRTTWKPEYRSGPSWVEEARGTIRRPASLVVEDDSTEDGQIAVRVGDTVTYTDIKKPDDVLTVQIVDGANDLSAGMIHRGKPLAQALLGAIQGDEVTMHLPGATARTFKVLGIKRETAPVST